MLPDHLNFTRCD